MRTPEEIVAAAKRIGAIGAENKEAIQAVKVAQKDDLGIAGNKLASPRVFLVQAIVDDSGSMKNLTGSVIESMGILKSELQKAVDEGDASECEILMTISFLNRDTVQPYARVEDCIDIDEETYHADGGTPLFTRTFKVLGGLTRKIDELARGGKTVQTYTCIVSDGHPTDAQGVGEDEQAASASDVEAMISTLTVTKQHIICGVNIGGEAGPCFQQMGIDEKWIINPSKDPFAFKEAMQQVSRVSRSVSKSRRAFEDAAKGDGFR